MVPPGLIDLGDLAPTGAASESLSSRVQLPSLGLSFVDDGCFHTGLSAEPHTHHIMRDR
jgi:hypothetical protein